MRYRWRSSAEFAKAAMHQQTLSGSSAAEVLDVRWANDDPNPRAIVRVHHEREQAMRDAYLKVSCARWARCGCCVVVGGGKLLRWRRRDWAF